jgi:SAM-dependent methyltransferase
MRSSTEVLPARSGSDWFASWFDSPHYHALYAHRDDAEAGGFVEALIQRLRPLAGSRMLDLACGAGRHSTFLASKGFQVTGIDLAASSIERARRFERPGLRFVRQDMRLPFGWQEFDYVFSFFTSFGYFDGPAEHVAVVRNMADALGAGGRLVLDYLNVRHAEARLTPEEVKEIDGVVYRLTRWTDAQHFHKRIAIDDWRLGEVKMYSERVARFGVGDFRRLFARHGLTIEAIHGDYRLGPYDAATSPRLILVARKGQDVRDRRRAHLRARLRRTRLSVSGVIPRYEASIH